MDAGSIGGVVGGLLAVALLTWAAKRQTPATTASGAVIVAYPKLVLGLMWFGALLFGAGAIGGAFIPDMTVAGRLTMLGIFAGFGVGNALAAWYYQRAWLEVGDDGLRQTRPRSEPFLIAWEDVVEVRFNALMSQYEVFDAARRKATASQYQAGFATFAASVLERVPAERFKGKTADALRAAAGR